MADRSAPEAYRVLVTEPLLNDQLPFLGQAAERREPVPPGRVEGEVHVLEGERQRELGREVALQDALQLGGLPGGHEWAAP